MLFKEVSGMKGQCRARGEALQRDSQICQICKWCCKMPHAEVDVFHWLAKGMKKALGKAMSKKVQGASVEALVLNAMDTAMVGSALGGNVNSLLSLAARLGATAAKKDTCEQVLVLLENKQLPDQAKMDEVPVHPIPVFPSSVARTIVGTRHTADRAVIEGSPPHRQPAENTDVIDRVVQRRNHQLGTETKQGEMKVHVALAAREEARLGSNNNSSSDKQQKYVNSWRESMTFPLSQMQRGLELIRFANQMQLASSRLQAETTSILQPATSTLHNEFQAVLCQVRQQDMRLDTLDFTVRDNQRTRVVEQEQQQLRADVERIQASLATAEATLPPLDMAALAVWDRPPDPRLYSIGAATAVQPSEVRRALEPWINAAGVAISDVELTLRREIQTKKLAQILGERHEGHFSRKAGNDGIVSCNSIPIVSVEVGSNASAATQLRWDSAAIGPPRLQPAESIDAIDKAVLRWTYQLGTEIKQGMIRVHDGQAAREEARFGPNNNRSTDKQQKYANSWRELTACPHFLMQGGLELICFAGGLRPVLRDIVALHLRGHQPVHVGVHGHRRRPGRLRAGGGVGHIPDGLQHRWCWHQGPAHQLEESGEHHLLRGGGHLRRDHLNHHGQQDRGHPGVRPVLPRADRERGKGHGRRLVHVRCRALRRALEPRLRHLRGRLRERVRAWRCTEAGALREDAHRGDLRERLGPLRGHRGHHPGERRLVPQV
ncbi:unnamed protein product, partial [Prorocentrum cordatum]